MSTSPRRKARKGFVPRFRLMPLTMTMLALVLVLKLQDLVIDGSALRQTLGTGTAYAEDEAGEEKPAEPTDETAKETKRAEEGTEDDAEDKEDVKRGGKLADQGEEEKALGQGNITIKKLEEIKAKQNSDQFSKVEIDILTNLSKRREALDLREKELDLKETSLVAAESRVSDKIREMKHLKEEVDKVLALYNEKQDVEIRGLVKIYEAMKPGDAAAIFNEMEMPILLEVVDKMSERKVAPILAGMNPKRARDVTQELAELRKVRADIKNQAGQ
jgi:flagellar motility protein MotE (MotC chaperone)